MKKKMIFEYGLERGPLLLKPTKNDEFSRKDTFM